MNKISRNTLYIILRDRDYTYNECIVTSLRKGMEAGCANCMFFFTDNNGGTSCAKYKYNLAKCIK